MKKNAGTRIIAEEFDITEYSNYKDIHGQYTDRFIKSSRCVKIEESEEKVIVAVAQSRVDSVNVLGKVHEGKSIETIVVKDSEFVEFIGKYVDGTLKIQADSKKSSGEFCLEDINSDSPAVNIINAICLEAIRRGASDIHIQGTKNGLNIRFRIDGVLQTVRTLEKFIFDSLVSRVKVMAGLNVMENRLCQDGRMSVQVGDRKLDFRVSLVPSVTGQNIVLRLFNGDDEDLTLEELGFSEANFSKIEDALKNPYGMILVTGPTGSGKTTTLHAMIKKMDMEHLKIVTIEDPVEKTIDGIEQIQVNDEIGLTFENILRHILRHDPDVIMVGEIRDRETAELAVRSALTGHLILSTIHTNDSISAISRMKNLGIEPYLIAGTLKTVIAQRLVRKTCKACKGKGCGQCGDTGYDGRTCVSETFVLDDKIASMVESEAPDAEIREYAAKHGFMTMHSDALLKIKNRVSTKQEILREGLA